MTGKAKARGRGRPPIPKNQRKRLIVHARMTEAEFKELKDQAASEGTTMSDVLLSAWRKTREGE